jgi:hypothetical protein
MACPLTVKTTETKLDRGLRKLSYTLVPAPYRLTKVSVTMKGSASAHMTTVGQKGFSEIEFFSSPQVPKSLETKDTVLANDPRPRVEYRPESEFKPFVVPESGSLAEGMIFSVLMQNQAGFFRKQIYSSGVFVRKISETFDQVIADEKLFRNVVASCYVFGPRREIASDYGKSAFAGKAE